MNVELDVYGGQFYFHRSICPTKYWTHSLTKVSIVSRLSQPPLSSFWRYLVGRHCRSPKWRPTLSADISLSLDIITVVCWNSVTSSLPCRINWPLTEWPLVGLHVRFRFPIDCCNSKRRWRHGDGIENCVIILDFMPWMYKISQLIFQGSVYDQKTDIHLAGCCIASAYSWEFCKKRKHSSKKRGLSSGSLKENCI